MMNKLKLQLMLFSFVFVTTEIFAQPFLKSTLPEVYFQASKFKNPWAGGLNSAIFNTIDLNFDGVKDLFLFDKQYNSIYPGVYKIRTFINKGTANSVDYEYAPQYEQLFPQDMTGWCTLVDFSCDGLEDIFAYNIVTGGIKVYRNTSSGGIISFALQYNSLQSCQLAPVPLPCSVQNLNALPVNLPVFTDVGGDGDLDILTFQVTGQQVEYHENRALELFGKCDTLYFEQLSDGFGHFQLNSFSNSASLGACRFTFSGNTDKANDGLHSGSCMLAYDEDGDGDKDLINGDLLGPNLLYLRNAGTIPGVNDSMDWQDSLFPVNNIPVHYVTFPSPFLFDADNDGVKDLIVSSCTENQSENFENNIYYKNYGDNINHLFQYAKKQFLTDEMVDLGAGANPVFQDVDGDGKKDLLVGNHGYFMSGGAIHSESAIAYFNNISTTGCPSFDLITRNFANLQQYALLDIVPSFGDLDGDGDADLLIGNYDGNLYYFTNNGGTYMLGAGGINFQSIDVGTNSAPQLVDMDGDLLLDLIIGETFGHIYYYRNTGTASTPVFTFVTSNLGGINVTNSTWTIYGNSVPCLFIENGQQKLLVGTESGYCFLYDNITGNLGGNFNLVSATAYSIFEPYRSAPAVADLNNDNSPEIIVGCYAGGLGFYTNNLSGCATGTENVSVFGVGFSVYPNPVMEKLIIDVDVADNSEKTIELFDVPGKLICHRASKKQKEVFDVSKIKSGMYVVRVTSANVVMTKKIIIR